MESNLFNLLFPRKCLGCGKIGDYFCAECLNLVLLRNSRICPMCGREGEGGLTHPGCQRTFGLDGLTSIFAYKGVIEKAIKKLKYRFITDLTDDLIELFLSFCGEDKAFVNFCQQPSVTLIPIPLSSGRKRWRGFNQAELLGKMIAERLGINFVGDCLLRIKETRPQVELNKEARRKNILGAFSLNRKCELKIKKGKFILFDDVWTTGATLREAAKVLKRGKAKKVWGLTIAR